MYYNFSFFYVVNLDPKFVSVCTRYDDTIDRKEKFKAIEERTCPFVVSDSWRVHALERFNEPSLKDIDNPAVADECDDITLGHDARETHKSSLGLTKEHCSNRFAESK